MITIVEARRFRQVCKLKDEALKRKSVLRSHTI